MTQEKQELLQTRMQLLRSKFYESFESLNKETMWQWIVSNFMPMLDNEEKKSEPKATDKTIILDGRKYIWYKGSWTDTATYLLPTLQTILKLNEMIALELEEEDNLITDVQELIDTAQIAKQSFQMNRAIKLLYRALKIMPGHEGALAVLSSLLRATGKPQEALKLTEPYYKLSKYGPLLTSRAAALCDIDQWEDGRKLLSKAFAVIGEEHKEEAFNLYHRICHQRPDLA